MCVLSSDLSKDQMEKRLIYSSMAATGFSSVQKEGEKRVSNESRNKW